MDSRKLRLALEYAKRGWAVIPLHHPLNDGQCSCRNDTCKAVGKHPRFGGWKENATTDEQTIREYFTQWPDANVGIVTGKISNLMILDVDGEEGRKSLSELEERNGPLPETFTAITGGGGRHLLFSYPDIEVGNKVKFLPGLDIRADGGLIVTPPSLHASGRPYEWEKSDVPSLPKPPHWLLNLIKSPPKQIAATGMVNEGQRNDYLFNMALSYAQSGLGLEELTNKVMALNVRKCTPPLSDKEVERIVKSAMKYTSRHQYSLTDMGNAQRLAAKHGKDIRYCPGKRTWFVWDGKRWASDSKYEIYRRAKQTVKSIYDEATETTEKADCEELIKHARRSESERALNAMINLAMSELGISINMNQFDQDPMLLNVENGTIDLRTGELKEHSREDFISKLVPVKYDPTAECPHWMGFLERVMQGNQELTGFLQRAIGYSLTGNTGEQVIFFLYGTGGNGKGTFLETILYLLNDYAATTGTETLMIKKSGGVNNDIARLEGKRFVIASEGNEGTKLDEALIKRLTGQDKIMARFLYQEFFEFDATFKIFFSTNSKPVIIGNDEGIWRRIRLIPFTVNIKPEERDNQLREKFKAELPGILRWAVEGCLLWQKQRLGEPQVVREATEEYRKEMDSIKEFLDDRCILDGYSLVLKGVLYAEYLNWCNNNGIQALDKNNFGQRLNQRGFKNMRKGHGGKRYWVGIRIMDNFS
jgi:putative DNA primase/helicase